MTPLHKYNTIGKRFVAGLIDGMVFLPFNILNNHFEHSGDKTFFIVLAFSYTICWTLYVVIGHGKYGQTIGKRLMGIKVFDMQEQGVIGFKRAFYREALWFFAATFGLVYFIVTAYNDSTPVKELSDTYVNGYVGATISMWFVLEIGTMLFNKKCRALHDHIAGAVVVDLNEMERADLQKHREQLLLSVQEK